MAKTHIKCSTGRSFCQIENSSKRITFASVATASCRNCVSLARRRPELVVDPEQPITELEKHEQRFVIDVAPGAARVEVVVTVRSLAAATAPTGQPSKMNASTPSSTQARAQSPVQWMPPEVRFS